MHTASAVPKSSRYWRLWFVAALCVLFLAVGVQYCVKAAGSSERANRSAFLRWRDQLQNPAEEDIYLLYNFPYPPIMAMLLEPLMRLPPLVGSLCWFLMKIGMTLAALHWFFRIVQSPQQPFPAWAKALTILLSLRPVLGDLSHGNVNLFILFLVVAALFAYHRRSDWSAGLLVGLGIACKVTSALFVPYFLWKRAWRTTAGCLIGLVLFLVVVPGCRFGFERNASLLRHWVDSMVTPFVVQGTVTSDHLNQSLPGVVFRLITRSPSSHDGQGLAPEYDNFLNLGPAWAGRMIKCCMALFAALIVWACRTPATARYGWRLAAEFSLIVLGMLLFSERTWKHHCVTLILPFAVLTYYLAICRPGRILRGYLIGSLAASVLFMASTGTLGLAPLHEVAQKAEVYGAYVWAYFVLVAALLTILRCPDPSAAASAALAVAQIRAGQAKSAA